jgi:hypothetical protein
VTGQVAAEMASTIENWNDAMFVGSTAAGMMVWGDFTPEPRGRVASLMKRSLMKRSIAVLVILLVANPVLSQNAAQPPGPNKSALDRKDAAQDPATSTNHPAAGLPGGPLARDPIFVYKLTDSMAPRSTPPPDGTKFPKQSLPPLASILRPESIAGEPARNAYPETVCQPRAAWPGPEPDVVACKHRLKSSVAENHAAATHHRLLPGKAGQLDFLHALRLVQHSIDRSFGIKCPKPVRLDIARNCGKK